MQLTRLNCVDSDGGGGGGGVANLSTIDHCLVLAAPVPTRGRHTVGRAHTSWPPGRLRMSSAGKKCTAWSCYCRHRKSPKDTEKRCTIQTRSRAHMCQQGRKHRVWRGYNRRLSSQQGIAAVNTRCPPGRCRSFDMQRHFQPEHKTHSGTVHTIAVT